jgi:mono/diheme cytochrome c family protein
MTLLHLSRIALASAAALVAAVVLVPAGAQTALHRYADADLALGEKLLAENRCAACHSQRVGGDGSAIYRPEGRINTPGALRGMVDYCSNELKLGLFPEEVTAIAAVLQRDHYRFPAKTPP